MQAPATAPAPIRLLCVEDNMDDFELLGLALARADPGLACIMNRVEDSAGFMAALERGVDVVLCDYHLPRFSPREALTLLDSHGLSIPLLVVTHSIGEEAALDVLRQGAKDYIAKDKLGTLPQIITRVLAEHERVAERDRLVVELGSAYERLKKLSSRLVMAQEHERTRVSRELHDVLGQGLTALIIHVHAARRMTDNATSIAYMDIALQTAQDALQQVRTLSFSLRPAQLDLLGLTEAIRSAVQRLAEPSGLAFSVTCRGQEPRILGANASVALRLVQEALTNTVRYAKASRVAVRVRFLPGERLAVAIADDGVGFDRAQLLGGPTGAHNMGLYGMIERTELVGGRFAIRTRPGHGVVIRAIL